MPKDPILTPQDYRDARAMGIALDGGLDGHEAAVERLYNTLVVAYQRLEAECAVAHRAARDAGEECEMVKLHRKVLASLLVLFLAVACWMACK